MKRTLFAIMAALCWLTMSAQDGFKVKFEGVAPDIMDFALAYFTFMDDDPENLPAEGEDEVGDIVYAALAYNPDPSKFEDADIELDVPILAKEYYIDGRCQAYLKLSANAEANSSRSAGTISSKHSKQKK